MTNTYTAENIDVLKGLEAVKRRPGMYTNTDHPTHLAQEIIDNSIDEATSGYANEIKICRLALNKIKVTDNGRGIPVDMHPTEHKPAAEVLFEELHSGGKFNASNYNFSGGLHGVGISVVNALSERVDIEIERDGGFYTLSYEDGIKVSPLAQKRKIAQKISGTSVEFTPNPKYFDSPNFKWDDLEALIKIKSIFCPNVKFILIDDVTGTTTEYFHDGDLKDYMRKTGLSEDCLGDFVFHSVKEREGMSVDVCCFWAEERTRVADSFVNLITTPQGGTHVAGLKAGGFDAFKDFIDIHELAPKSLKLTADDVFKDMNFIISFKMSEPTFAGQTKERLSSRTASRAVQMMVKDALLVYLNDNFEPAQIVCQRILSNANSRIKSGKKIERKKIGKIMAIPGKLTDCKTNLRDQAELFLVEGDSAGGSAKQARDKEFQAIMPLRGKILNTWEVDPSSVLASKEISDISTAIGVSPNSDDLSELRYGKICVLCDADSDGYHIATLLTCLFVKHFRPLVEMGNIYIAVPPLYRIDIGKEAFYALDDSEKEEIIRKNSNGRKTVSVQRFKGLGEMNPSQLRETTMNEANRRLIRLTLPEDGDDSMEFLDMLMAKKRSKDRLEWIENSALMAEEA